MTASQSQKSSGGFFGLPMKKGRPSRLPVPVYAREACLAAPDPAPSALLLAVAPALPRAVLDREAQNRPADSLRQIGVQHHAQPAGAGLRR